MRSCFAVIAPLWILSGCCAQGALSTLERDSTHIEVVVKRQVIRDTVIVDIPHERESVAKSQDSVSYLENSLAESYASLLEGVLHHTLSTKPQPILHPIEMEVEVKDSIIYRHLTTTKIVEKERELNFWQEMQIRGFRILLALLAAVVAIKHLLP